MEDLVKRWSGFQLTEEEAEVVQSGAGESLLSAANARLCVVGRVLSSRRVNVEAFRSVMKFVWRVHGGTRVEAVGDNLFAIQFRSMEEKSRVLTTGLWTFDRTLVVLVEPQGSDTVSQLCFDRCSFWVQIHNVPLNWQVQEKARRLGGRMGQVEEVDGVGLGDWIGPILRLRMMLQIDKPLRRGFRIAYDSGKELCCPVLYERLPDFCHGCERLGHVRRECGSVYGEGEVAGDQYGEWMRAIPLTLVSGRKEGEGSGRGSRVSDRGGSGWRTRGSGKQVVENDVVPSGLVGSEEVRVGSVGRGAVVDDPVGGGQTREVVVERPACIVGEESVGPGQKVGGSSKEVVDDGMKRLTLSIEGVGPCIVSVRVPEAGLERPASRSVIGSVGPTPVSRAPTSEKGKEKSVSVEVDPLVVLSDQVGDHMVVDGIQDSVGRGGGGKYLKG